MNKSLIFKSIYIILHGTLILGSIFLIAANWIIDPQSSYITFDYNKYRVIFYILGVLILFINLQLIKIFNTIKNDTPFIKENVLALKSIAVSAIIMGGTFLFSLAITASLLRIFAGVAFICAGLCAYVLSQLFKSAVYIKEENDYTI